MSVLALTLISCDDNDNTPTQPSADSNLWGTTYSHANLGAYPDIYSKYWVYAYNITDNPNVGLRLTGLYPKARFFSFSIYNALKGEVIDGLDDVNVTPDDGYHYEGWQLCATRVGSSNRGAIPIVTSRRLLPE